MEKRKQSGIGEYKRHILPIYRLFWPLLGPKQELPLILNPKNPASAPSANQGLVQRLQVDLHKAREISFPKVKNWQGAVIK